VVRCGGQVTNGPGHCGHDSIIHLREQVGHDETRAASEDESVRLKGVNPPCRVQCFSPWLLAPGVGARL
jgi:hypothetical protein